MDNPHNVSEQRNLRNLSKMKNYQKYPEPPTTNPQYQEQVYSQAPAPAPAQVPAPTSSQAPFPIQESVQIYQNPPPQPYVQVEYAQPIVMVQPTRTIMVNQPVIHHNLVCRTLPLNANCPFCKTPIVTLTSLSLNCQACCCCTFCTLIFLCMQCLNDKECGIYDCTHTCPNCGNLIGKYCAM